MSSEEARAKINELVVKLRRDPNYRQEIQADPAVALAAAGLDESGIDEVLYASGLSDVSGYVYKKNTKLSGSTASCSTCTTCATTDYGDGCPKT